MDIYEIRNDTNFKALTVANKAYRLLGCDAV
jgi:hypothetical protein